MILESGNLFWKTSQIGSKVNMYIYYICTCIPGYEQVLNDKGYDGAVADVWSCGVILFVLMAGFLPFDEADLVTLYRKVDILFLQLDKLVWLMFLI